MARKKVEPKEEKAPEKPKAPKKVATPKTNTMLEEFVAKESEFSARYSQSQGQVIDTVKKIMDSLDTGPDGKGFTNWSGEKLISAREKLSRYSEYLGEFITEHETHSDFAYIWRKGVMAKDWQPVKTELESVLKDSRVTNVEVENVLTDRYLEEQYYSMFHRRRADFLSRFNDATTQMIRSIDSRLRELERQRSLPQ